MPGTTMEHPQWNDADGPGERGQPPNAPPDPHAGIQASLQIILARMPELVRHFYDLLFLEQPGFRPMFSADMLQQQNHLATALALVAKYVNNVHLLATPLRQLGARHVAYGAKDEHYPLVCDVMLRAMRHVGGPQWTDEIDRLWSDALAAASELMKQGAAEAARASAA